MLEVSAVHYPSITCSTISLVLPCIVKDHAKKEKKAIASQLLKTVYVKKINVGGELKSFLPIKKPEVYT